MIKKLLLVFLALSSLSTNAQFHFSGEVTLKGLGSTGEELPFWMYHNTRGRISDDTNFAGLVNAAVTYQLSENSFLEAGAGVLYRDGSSENILPDESYLKFENSWLEVIAGRKQKEDLYNGLSATNENILWSLNARPLPGLQLRTTRPILIFPEAGIGFEASLAEYVLEKDRHVSRARVHHKSLHFTYQPNEEWLVKAGIQHFAQWGGVSKTTGQQPEGLIDYLLVVTGREGREDAVGGGQQHVLGNHLGSYELYITRSFPEVAVKFIYNHIFEDGTGSRFANFPDGRYGIFLDLDGEINYIDNLIYEFYYTKNQSTNTTAPHKNDAYFNNYLTYRSGWTYEERILGAPFFTYNPKENLVVNNRFVAHHLGISGNLLASANLPYKILGSYARNGGTVEKGYSPKQDVGYLFTKVGILRTWLNLDLEFAAEYKDTSQPNYGLGIVVSKNF